MPSSGWLLRLVIAFSFAQGAVSMARPAVSYRALALGADERAIGVIAGVYALLPLFAAGFCLGVGQPLSMTTVVQAAPAEARSTALALRLTGTVSGRSRQPPRPDWSRASRAPLPRSPCWAYSC
jgi:hypothetical protein